MSNHPKEWRKNNPEKRYEQKRREKVRVALRKRGILPPAGEEMNEEQQKINDQISNNDFSFWELIRFEPHSERLQNKKYSPEYYLWLKNKKENVSNGMDFNLSVNDIEIPEFCPYLETRLITDLDYSENPNFITLDRIDTKKGYIRGNVQIISKLAFQMKNNSDVNLLIRFASNVIKIHGMY